VRGGRWELQRDLLQAVFQLRCLSARSRCNFMSRTKSVGAEVSCTKDFTATAVPSRSSSREGGDPETSESRLGEALDPRLRGDDEQKLRGSNFNGMTSKASRRGSDLKEMTSKSLASQV